MKKLLGIILALALLLGCASALADDPITLTYAEVNPLDGTIVGEMAKAFKEKAEEVSGGEITIDIQAGGVLGSEDQILDNLLGGGNITDISRISAFALTQYGCDKAKLLSIPYTFVNEEHFWKFADSELAQEFLLEPQELGLGLRGLCYGEEGFRHFFFKNEVKGLEDLKGLKIRVSSDPVMTGMVTNLGASATTVAFTELYSALNTGVVDGAEQPLSGIDGNAFYEVANNLTLDNHTYNIPVLLFSERTWNSLNEDTQALLREKWTETIEEYYRPQLADYEAGLLEKFQEKGMAVHEITDYEKWVEAVEPVWAQYGAGLEDLIAAVQAK